MNEVVLVVRGQFAYYMYNNIEDILPEDIRIEAYTLFKVKYTDKYEINKTYLFHWNNISYDEVNEITTAVTTYCKGNEFKLTTICYGENASTLGLLKDDQFNTKVCVTFNN